jgi:hypothetical protein
MVDRGSGVRGHVASRQPTLQEGLMVGVHGAYARQYLWVFASVTTLVFALPMIFAPLAWGRMMRFTVPAADTDLAVYFGRCLGCMALVTDLLTFRAAATGTGIVFVFELGLVFSALMVLVHAYGAFKRIQPITETIETALWLLLVLLFWSFFPAGQAA